MLNLKLMLNPKLRGLIKLTRINDPRSQQSKKLDFGFEIDSFYSLKIFLQPGTKGFFIFQPKKKRKLGLYDSYENQKLSLNLPMCCDLHMFKLLTLLQTHGFYISFLKNSIIMENQ